MALSNVWQENVISGSTGAFPGGATPEADDVGEASPPPGDEPDDVGLAVVDVIGAVQTK